MLNEKHYLLLCELVRTGLLNSQSSGSVMEIVRNLETALVTRKQGDLAAAILSSASFADYELQEQGETGVRDWFTFKNVAKNSCVIVAKEPDDSTYTYFMSDEASQQLLATANPELTYIFTGLGQGGWRAAELAEVLDKEAIVFGAPSIEELPGKAINYVGEDDPVGDYTEKVVFVKERDELSEEDDDDFYQKLVFDDYGKPIVTEQSEFSRFVGWFYHATGTVEPDVWKIFFPGPEDDDETAVLSDLGVYSVFLKVGELNKEGIIRSIHETVRYAGRRLDDNRSELTAELSKITDEDYETKVPETVEIYSMKASELVVQIFESVQTVLLGVALFTLGQESFDVDTPMDSFQAQIFALLDQEQERITDCLDQAIARHLENFLKLPELNFDW